MLKTWQFISRTPIGAVKTHDLLKGPYRSPNAIICNARVRNEASICAWEASLAPLNHPDMFGPVSKTTSLEAYQSIQLKLKHILSLETWFNTLFSGQFIRFRQTYTKFQYHESLKIWHSIDQ